MISFNAFLADFDEWVEKASRPPYGEAYNLIMRFIEGELTPDQHQWLLRFADRIDAEQDEDAGLNLVSVMINGRLARPLPGFDALGFGEAGAVEFEAVEPEPEADPVAVPAALQHPLIFEEGGFAFAAAFAPHPAEEAKVDEEDEEHKEEDDEGALEPWT